MEFSSGPGACCVFSVMLGFPFVALLSACAVPSQLCEFGSVESPYAATPNYSHIFAFLHAFWGEEHSHPHPRGKGRDEGLSPTLVYIRIADARGKAAQVWL